MNPATFNMIMDGEVSSWEGDINDLVMAFEEEESLIVTDEDLGLEL